MIRVANLMHTVRQRWNLAVLAVLGSAVLLAIWGTGVRIQESMDASRQEVQKAGQLIVDALDHELDVYRSSLLGMKYLADRFTTGRTQAAENPVERLQPVPDRGGYQSVLPPTFKDRHTVGRITGLGAVPSAQDPIAEEMAMAVGLTPLMRAIKERSDDIPWVQYASARRFMYIFPDQGSERFFFTPELSGRDYLAKATPQANPTRSIFWSEPYEDAAGQGLIVTVTQPIDRGDNFLGSVSIDFKVAALSRFLRDTPIPRTHVHLVTKEGRRLAQAWDHVDDPSAGVHEAIRIPLDNAPWFLEMRINPDELLLAAIRGRMWHVVAVVILILTFVFVALLLQSYQRVRRLAITDGLTGLYNRRYFDLVAQH